jgi:hypothetical protein
LTELQLQFPDFNIATWTDLAFDSWDKNLAWKGHCYVPIL